MSAIYIISDKGKLGKHDDSLVFRQIDGSLTTLFPFKIEQLILIGNISISGDALRILTKYKIPTVFISTNGKYNSRLVFQNHKNVLLRQNQYRLIDNKKESLKIAQAIVIGKIKNQISFMQRIKRKDNAENDIIAHNIAKMKNYLKKINKVTNIKSLGGLEGIAAKNYFEVFKFNIYPEWAKFHTRSKNPPKSNVNAVLSFLYTLLLYRIEASIESQGLDTMVGNLHVIDYGKSTLAFDLMEEYRCPIVDTLCCVLFNLKVLNKNDFYEHRFGEDDFNYPYEKNAQDEQDNKIKGILLNDSGLKKIIKAFEEKIHSTTIYLPLNKSLSYEQIIFEQVKQYKQFIEGIKNEYIPYFFK